jgi:hypothetical protein
MSLTLDEIKSLIGAIGIKVPEEILTRKEKAQEFAVRREKIAGEASGKPDDWRLKGDFNDIIKRAVASADKQDFAAALGSLDDAEQLLQQPDAPPPPAPPPTPPEPAMAEPVATAPAPEPAAAETPPPAPPPPTPPEPASAPVTSVFPIWRDAKERVDAQVSRLQGALRQSKDPFCQRIADMGLNGVTGNLQVGLQVALTEYDKSGGKDAKSAAKAGAIIAQYQQFLQKDKAIALCDENPFGIKCDIRGTLLEALGELQKSFKS